MSTRTTAILAALLAVLGGIFYFTEVRGGKKDPDAAMRLFAVKADDVEALELRTPKGEIALRREGEAWWLERPLATKGDRAAIAGLLTALVNAKADRTLEDPPKTPADFGLDKPALTVRFRVKGGEGWRHLEFGGRNPTGAWAYVRKDGAPQVILLPETLRPALQKSALDLRDKSVMDLPADRVTRLVVYRGGQVVVDLQKGDHWELVRPVKVRADDWQVSALVRQAAELKAKEFAAEPAVDLKAFGLDRPAVRLELWERGANAPKVLALAEPKDRRDTAYARHEDTMTVVVVDKAILSDVPSGPWEIRDKSLFRYANKDVKRVRLAGPHRAVAVEREDERRWKVVEPAPGPADPRAVTDLLFKLTGLRVDGVAAERPDRPEKYGLDKPELTITVTRMDGTEEGTLLIGKEEKEQRYVQVKGEAPVYTISANDLKDLPRAPEDFTGKKPERKA